MKTQSKTPYILSIFLTEAVGVLSGWISREGTAAFSQSVLQPKFSPPTLLFPIVWTLLYALMGVSFARIYTFSFSSQRNLGLNLYTAQLIVNFFWSPIFFNAGAYGFAFVWILLLIGLAVGMVLVFFKIDPLSAWLQIPYLLWLLFAAYLNYAVWRLNP